MASMLDPVDVLPTALQGLLAARAERRAERNRRRRVGHATKATHRRRAREVLARASRRRNRG